MRKPEFTRAQWRTLIVLWATYGSFYFCRVGLGPVMRMIADELTLPMTAFGIITGALKLGYATGEVVNGQLVERFGAKRVLVTGMVGSFFGNVLFALAPSVSSTTRVTAVFATFAFINGFSQAAGWPSTVKIMSNWFTATQRGRMMGVIGTSYQLGTAVTIVGAGLLASAFGNWRAAFFIPAALFFLSTVHARLRVVERPAEPHADAPPTQTERLSVRESLTVTLTNPRIWVLAFGLFGLDIVRFGFLDWAPSHLFTVQGSGISASALKTAVLPLSGAVGALVSGWITDRFFQSRRAPVICVLLTLVGALTFLYARVAPSGDVTTTVACLAAVGFCLYGAQILLVGTAAQDFARRGATGAAAGFIDCMGYVGAFTGDMVTGWILSKGTWENAITFWAAAAIVSALLVSVLWRARQER